MTKSRKLPWMAAVTMSLIFAPLAPAQEKTITFQVNDANQPAGGVPLYVLAGGRKFSSSTPPTGTTDNAGKFVFPPGVLSSNKPHTQMEVYEVCVNGRKVIFIIPKGSEDQLPKDTEDCKKIYIGGFYWDGGSTVTVDLGLGGGVTQTGGRLVVGVTPAKGERGFWGQFGGGLGVKNFGGAAKNCAPLLQFSSPTGSCNTSENSLAADLSASLNYGLVGVAATLFRANQIELSSTAKQGPATSTLKSTMQPEGVIVAFHVYLPVSERVTLVPHVGPDFFRVNEEQTQTLTLGGTTTTTSDSGKVHGTGLDVGAAVQFHLGRHVDLEVRYDYLRFEKKPVLDEHNNMLSINLLINLGK